MKYLISALFNVLLLMLLLVAIAVTVVGGIYVLNIELKETFGFDLVEKMKGLIKR